MKLALNKCCIKKIIIHLFISTGLLRWAPQCGLRQGAFPQEDRTSDPRSEHREQLGLHTVRRSDYGVRAGQHHHRKEC